MKKKLQLFMKNPFIRNVFILASGTAMAQAVNMFFSPLITRIYGPEAYGLMGTFTAIIQIVGPVAALSYPIAIVLPKADKDAKEIVRLSFFTTLFNTMVISVGLFFFNDVIVKVFNLYSISHFLYFIPIVVLSAGSMQILQQWLVRKNLFKISAKANLIETSFVNSGKLIVGLFYPSASILIFFTAIRQGVRALLMYFYMGKINFARVFSSSRKKRKAILNQAKKYKDFPLYRTPEVALSAVTNNIPILILTSFFGPATAGFYSIAKTVLTVPTTLIAQSVGDVFYPRVAQTARDKKKIVPLIVRATLYLSLVGLIPYGIVILFGPSLFSFIFGQDWIIAGEYARWISLWSFFNFINKPSVQSLPVISAQKFQLMFSICKLLFTSLGLIIGFYVFKSDVIAIALFSIIGGILYIFLIITTVLKGRKYDDNNII